MELKHIRIEVKSLQRNWIAVENGSHCDFIEDGVIDIQRYEISQWNSRECICVPMARSLLPNYRHFQIVADAAATAVVVA